MTVYGALYKAVHKAPSGLSSEQIADALGKSLSSLTYEVNPLYPSRKFGVESLAPLMLAGAGGWPYHAGRERSAGGRGLQRAARHPVPPANRSEDSEMRERLVVMTAPELETIIENAVMKGMERMRPLLVKAADLEDWLSAYRVELN